MTVNRGSEWGKWDLHVHTPLSFESHFEISQSERDRLTPIPELDDFDTTDRYDPLLWAKYIEELESVEDVDCIAITDYFSLEGYEIIQHLRNHGYLDNFDLVLPNIEFRIGTLTGENNRVNLHVIFSEETSIDTIRQEFLSNLTIRLDGGDERSLRPGNLKEFGAQAKEYHDSAEGLSDYEAGCTYAWVRFEDITDALESSDSLFEGKYLIVLSGAEWSEISWFGQDAEIRRQLLADSHALFSGNPSDRVWASGKGDLSEREYKDEFGSLKPVLHGSDAHDFERLCQPDEDRYCWIKANPTFEGLKQVIFEPIERLQIGSTNPGGFTQIHTLDSLQIRNGEVNSDLKIADSDIPFNEDLISVIGNQGAGKTALLDLIANCFYERTKDKADDNNSFISRIQDSEPNIKTEISFSGEEVDSFSKKTLQPQTVEGPAISHIPQGKIVEYCQKGNELHERIRTLVTKSVQRETPELVEEFEQKKEEVIDLSREVRSINAEFHEINPPQVKADIAEEKRDYTQIETLKDNKQEEINQFKERHQEQLVETEAENLQSDLDDLIEDYESIDGLIDDIDSTVSYLETVDNVNNLIESIQDQQSLVDSDISVERIEFQNQQESLGDIRQAAEVAQEELSTEIDDIRSELDELDEVDEMLSELLDEKRQLRERMSNTEERISKLNEKMERVEKLESERISIFVSYVDSFFDLNTMYEDIATAFSDGGTAVLDDIEIEPQIELTENRTRDFVDVLDNRSLNRREIKPYIDQLGSIVSDGRPEDLQEQIEEYISNIEGFRDRLLESRDPIEFDSLLYGDCLESSEEICYQGTQMDQLSRGQKGTVLLRIYLAEGEGPLILDSPEENLDNQFVFKELIGAVREAKKDRQIFLATHDANLVVNTDSEQIVIAEFDHGEISFKGGALEDQRVRGKSKEILEGGDEAFKLREEKYDLTPR